MTDLVPPDVIKLCVADCTSTRGDCALTADISGQTMLGGGRSEYDKAGLLKITNPNAMNVDVKCLTCGASWVVRRGMDGFGSVVQRMGAE